jgi:Ser/Thr protein kinase RdoA (MazF antagonist)
MHVGNLLFENGVLTACLDFDTCQKNVRVFDLVYLGSSLLVDNYLNNIRVREWSEVFLGVLQGYNELSKLNVDEIKAIPYLFLFVEVLFTAYFAKNNEMESTKRCIEMVNWTHTNILRYI